MKKNRNYEFDKTGAPAIGTRAYGNFQALKKKLVVPSVHCTLTV